MFFSPARKFNFESLHGGRDPYALKEVLMEGLCFTDAQFSETLSYLLTHPNSVTSINLGRNKLTDASGIKLAHFLAASTTIKGMDLSQNKFGKKTYLAIASALRVNTSLAYLDMEANYDSSAQFIVDEVPIHAAFIYALHLGPTRPPFSRWTILTRDKPLSWLMGVASSLCAPSMLVQVAIADESCSKTKVRLLYFF